MVTQRRRRVLRGYTELTVIRSADLWTLYRAFDVESSQWVAMRVVPARLVEEYLLDEMAAEVNALQPVSHDPNIATIHRLLRRGDGSVALVTDLCRESLSDRLTREGPLPVADVIEVAHRAAAALAAVHAAGRIHRNLTPSKLLTARSGQTVLGGLGLAVLRMATRTPATPASPHSAPEIFEGKPASPATDVYGLASTMYQLIHGHPAFEAFEGEAPANLILRIVGEPAPVLRVPGAPLALADMIAEAMSKDPAARPPRPAEFARQLMSLELPRRPVPDPGVVPTGGDPLTVLVPPRPSLAGLSDRPPPVRNVLTPLTAGRGAPPLTDRDEGRGTQVPPPARPVGPKFSDPDLGATIRGEAGFPPTDDPTQPSLGPGASTENAVDGDPGRADHSPLVVWALLGLAVAVAVLAVLVVVGVL